MIKTDSNGNIIWDKTFGDSGNNSGFEVIEISSGGYIIVGSTHLNEPWYRAELWLIKTDSDGNMIWDKTFEDDGSHAVQKFKSWARNYGIRVDPFVQDAYAGPMMP